jgi:hypothetical protein
MTLLSRSGKIETRRPSSRRGVKVATLVGLPLVAAVVAGAVLTRTPQQYRASTTVTAPPAAATGAVDSPASIGQFAADFEGALQTSELAVQVARETGAQVSDIQNGLSAAQVGRSSDIQITFVTSVRRLASPVVVSAARAAFHIVARPEVVTEQAAVVAAQAGVTQAQARYDHDRAASDALSSQGIATLAIEEYRSKLSELSLLEVSEVTAQISDITAIRPSQLDFFGGKVKGLQATITARQQELAALAPAAIASDGVQRDLASSLKDLTAARGRLQTSKAVLAGRRTVPATAPPTLSPISRAATIAKGVVVVVLVAILLAIALLVVPFVLRLPRRIREEQAVQPS